LVTSFAFLLTEIGVLTTENSFPSDGNFCDSVGAASRAVRPLKAETLKSSSFRDSPSMEHRVGCLPNLRDIDLVIDLPGSEDLLDDLNTLGDIG
jgi:hypothetical protein